jgi:ABC-type amino acid transport substrate-binding protein
MGFNVTRLKRLIAGLAAFALIAVVTSSPVAAAGILDQVHAGGTLQLLWLRDAAPFSYESNGQPAGYVVELCRRIAALIAPGAKTEWRAVRLDEGLTAMSQGQADLFCAPITITLGRMAAMDFTSPIFIGGPGVMLRSDASPLLMQWLDPEQPLMPSLRSLQLESAAPRRIAVQQGSTGAAWLQGVIARDNLAVTVVQVPSDDAAEQLLAAGQVEAWVSERAVLASRAAHDPALRDFTVVGRMTSAEPLAIALPQDPQFSVAVETALAHIIRGADFDALYANWFGADSSAGAAVIRGVTPLE